MSGFAEKTIQEMCGLFGVTSSWDIGVNFTDTPGGNPEWDAAADTNSEYLMAIIDVRPTLVDDPRYKQLVAHEVMHIALSESRAVFISALNSIENQGASDELLARWEYVENRTIQRITRAVLAALHNG